MSNFYKYLRFYNYFKFNKKYLKISKFIILSKKFIYEKFIKYIEKKIYNSIMFLTTNLFLKFLILNYVLIYFLIM